MVEWSEEFMLYFNIEKCKVMHFGGSNPKMNYSMKDEVLHKSETERDLGVTINTNLSFATHINTQINKANQALGLVKRTFSYLSEDLFRNVYLTYIRPHLEYCVQAWSPFLQGDIEKLEKFQRRATKLVPSLSELPYEERIEKLQIPTLKERRIRGDMIETFKIIKGYENMNTEDFFQQRVYPGQLRGHNFMLQKHHSNKDKRKNTFSQRVVNKWNELPIEVIESSSVNIFKNRLDNHRRRY